MGFAENEFFRYLSKFEQVPFDVELDKVKRHIGKGKPRFKIEFKQIPDIMSLLESTTVTFGEAYADGELEVEGNLYKVLKTFLLQFDKCSYDKKALKKLLYQSGSKKSLKKKIKANYKLGRHFYQLILDESMCYSAGYFKTNEDSLYQAQINNIDNICNKLNLKSGMSICDISCGWGTFMIEAAKKYDVDGVIVTFGRKQEEEIKERVKNEGLEDKIQVRDIDYRELPNLDKKFDCVVSVGILEYIGRDGYIDFFKIIRKIMKKDGLFLLQSVNTSQEKLVTPWIKKHIKPGAQMPLMQQLISDSFICGMKIVDMEDMRRNAARTYKYWIENFNNNKDEIEEMYDRKFIRTWELYLNVCRAAYNIGMFDSHQILFSNGVNNNLPQSRWF